MSVVMAAAFADATRFCSLWVVFLQTAGNSLVVNQSREGQLYLEVDVLMFVADIIISRLCMHCART